MERARKDGRPREKEQKCKGHAVEGTARGATWLSAGGREQQEMRHRGKVGP